MRASVSRHGGAVEHSRSPSDKISRNGREKAENSHERREKRGEMEIQDVPNART